MEYRIWIYLKFVHISLTKFLGFKQKSHISKLLNLNSKL
jgi:hypothetical protein